MPNDAPTPGLILQMSCLLYISCSRFLIVEFVHIAEAKTPRFALAKIKASPRVVALPGNIYVSSYYYLCVLIMCPDTSMCPNTKVCVLIRGHSSLRTHSSMRTHVRPIVDRKHMSAYVSMCQHTSADVCLSVRTHVRPSVNRKHTLAYVSIRQLTYA
jgi:hypothetical protein